MLLFLSVLSEILLGLSVLIGLILFRVIAKDIIPLVALLFLTCIFEMISFLLMKNGVHNHFLPNILTLIEFDVCSYMLWLWLRETKFSIIIPYLATFFSLFWLITTFFVLNFSETNNYTGIMQSVLMIILALVLAFHITRRTKRNLFTHYRFLIAIAWVMYFSVTMIVTSLSDLLLTNYTNMFKVAWEIKVIANTIEYLIFGYAIICSSVKVKSSLPSYLYR